MSALDNALERRDEARARYLRDHLGLRQAKSRLRAFSLADEENYLPPVRRLTVGVAFGAGPEDYGLALRPGASGGLAHRAAMELAEAEVRDGGWADIRVVGRLAVPSRQAVADAVAGRAPGLDAAAQGNGPAPLRIGASVSHPKAAPGSIGGFVALRGHGEGLIGACHVLANCGRGVDLDDEDKRPAIYHPATGDRRHSTARERVALLHDFVSLDGGKAELDVAVGRLLAGRETTGNVVPDVPGARDIGRRILGPGTAEAAARVRSVAKVGRTTHYTRGSMSAGFFQDVPLDVPGQGLVYYDRQYEITGLDDASFGEPGDSGAVVFDTASFSAIGLIVGGGSWHDNGVERMLIYACDLAESLKEMKAEWI